MRAYLTALSLLASAALFPVAASATETQWWTINGAPDYAKSESHGVVVRPDGTLEPGPASASWPDDSLHVAWAIALLADGSVAIAGDHGRIDRWTERTGVRPWVRLGAGQVLSLARDGDGLLAGTGPRGLIYRISARGDTTRVAATGERYVWGLAPAGGGAVWAATGTQGRLVKAEGGRVRTVFDSDENNLVSLVPDGAGGVYVGGDSKGRVYHVSGSGGIRTLFDAGEDEIRSLARAADGAIWAAGLSASGVSEETGAEDEHPAPVRASAAGGHATVYRIVPDSTVVAWWTSPQPLVYALAIGRDGVLAATGNRAGVYRVESENGASLLLAPPQGQATALAVGSDGAAWAATSNPVALWRLGPGRAARGEITSATLDVRRTARFGHVRMDAHGSVRLLTRSGNSDTPDTTWSAWAPLSGSAQVASPPARYLQWKAELEGADAGVSEVAVAWREPNLAPHVEDLSVAPQAQNFREGEIGSRSEAVTQTLASGQKVEYSMMLSTSKPIRELPLWARGVRTLQWHGVDPNGDALTYRIEVRREDGGDWVTIGKDLEPSVYTWNTNTLPDGRYRLRVTASDAPSNAVGEERTGTATSEPFTVDNTPPVISELAGEGGQVHGRAEDAMGPLWRLEIAVDDGEWRMLAAHGGMTDEKSTEFSVTLPGLAPGEHLVSVRAVDMAGNSATRAIHVRIAKGR